MGFLSSKWLVLAAFSYPSVVLTRYDEKACCNKALRDRAFIETSTPLEAYICGQQYDASIPPAPDLRVNYTYCSHHCSGIRLPNASVSSEWVGLIVQFLLPSVIFSMTIPRQQKIEVGWIFDAPVLANIRFRWLPGLFRLAVWVGLSIFLVVPLIVLDSILWISAIVATAGPMMVGGLYEALLDSRLLKIIRDATLPEPLLTHHEQIQLLVAVVSGNLMRDIGNPQIEIPQSLSTAEDAQNRTQEIRTRLLSLMSSQNNFGSAVGAPVLFYLGAFVYSIVDLKNQIGSVGSAGSVAFAVEWMIIVHVAIVSGCLLASNNPATSAAIVGLPPDEKFSSPYRASTLDSGGSAMMAVEGSRTKRWKMRLGVLRDDGRVRHVPWFSQAYETRYQPVSLWSRGSNKMDWIQDSSAYLQHEWFQKKVQLSALDWTLSVFSPAFLLIVLPPAAGGILTYSTPPVSWGCRSLSLICYAGTQVVLTFIAVMKAATSSKNFRLSHPKASRLTHVITLSIFIPVAVLSFLTMIGSTLMYITGTFQNCFCYLTAQYWLSPDSGPGIHVASDTRDQRTTGQYWVVMSTVATGFMALIGYSGWWYQRKIRQDFAGQVKGLRSDDGMVDQSIPSRISTAVDTSTTGFSGTQASLSRQSTHTLTRTNTLSANSSSRLSLHQLTFNSPTEMEFRDDS